MLALTPIGIGDPARVPCWTQGELTLTSGRARDNQYTQVEVHAIFEGPAGVTLVRPGFWDGEATFKIRFAPPAPGRWRFRTLASDPADQGLHEVRGHLDAHPYQGDNPLLSHGFLRMSSGGRNVVHADGTPFFMVADTPWGLPWRATVEQTQLYARDRQTHGFNAALLMSVQPDRFAKGPRGRGEPASFDVGFEDLREGFLQRLNPGYFQYLDQLLALLIEHGIVPVLQPVFQGYGWKGLTVLGTHAVPEQYARYCRYLVARYGAQPAMYLVSADGTGFYPCVEAGGHEIETWDAYRQPAGIHYNPFEWQHENRAHQAAAWLDFQWAQTGHKGEHKQDCIRRMTAVTPVKAIANGEPTYEGICSPDNGAGVWQLHEAWSNLCAGGTMGIVYGAGGLWQWKYTDDEPGWPAWADGKSWRTCLEYEGRVYAGHVGRAMAGTPFTDMTYRPDLAAGRDCVAIPGKFYVVYLPEGGDVVVQGLEGALPWGLFDPKRGAYEPRGTTTGATLSVQAPQGPSVLMVGRP
jgi:hypothetical protein